VQENSSTAANILVVEDDEAMRELLRLHLSNAGYRVTLAEDAAVAGRHLLESPHDLVVADVELPYLSGLEFAAILMADTTMPAIPVVLISAHEQYRARADVLGAAFLLKPMLKGALLETIEQALSGAPKKVRDKSEVASGPVPIKETVRQATLRRARDLAGGVSFLGRQMGVGVNALDAMLWGREEIPGWVFLRAAEFVADAEAGNVVPPGFPANWADAEWCSA
jgi:CheY-like chemotaxis protein